MFNGKVGLGAAGGFRSAMHMVAVVAGYRKAFVKLAQGWPFLFTFAQMGLEVPLSPYKGSISATRYFSVMSLCMHQAP